MYFKCSAKLFSDYSVSLQAKIINFIAFPYVPQYYLTHFLFCLSSPLVIKCLICNLLSLLSLTHYMIDILDSAFAIPFSKAFPLQVNHKPDPKPFLFL